MTTKETETQKTKPRLDWQWAVRNSLRDLPIGSPVTEGLVDFLKICKEEFSTNDVEWNRAVFSAKERELELRKDLVSFIQRNGKEKTAELISEKAQKLVSTALMKQGAIDETLENRLRGIINVISQTMVSSYLPENDSREARAVVDSMPKDSVNSLSAQHRANLFSSYSSPMQELATSEGVKIPVNQSKVLSHSDRLNKFALKNNLAALFEEEPVISLLAAIAGATALGYISISTSAAGVRSLGGDPIIGGLLAVGATGVEIGGIGALKRVINEAKADNNITVEEWILIGINAGAIFGFIGFDLISTWAGLGKIAPEAKLFFTPAISFGFEFCLNQIPKAYRRWKGNSSGGGRISRGEN